MTTPASFTKDNVQQLIRRGRLSEAKAMCQMACKESPDTIDPWLSLAAVYAEDAEYAEAIKCCRSALEIQPDNFDGLLNLGIALEITGNINSARQQFLSLINVYPGSKYPRNRLARIFLSEGDFDSALKLYREVITMEVSSPVAWNGAGTALLNKGDYEAALENFRQGIKYAPGNADYLRNAGIALLRLNKPHDAARFFSQAVAIKPDRSDLKLNMANCHVASGDVEAAIKVLDSAVIQDSDNPEINSRLGELLLHCGQLDDAARYLSLAISFNPNNITALYSLGNVFKKQGDFIKATDFFNKACQLYRGYPVKQDGAGRCHLPEARSYSFLATSAPKLKHDLEQIEYLVSKGYLSKEFNATIDKYKTVCQASESLKGTKGIVGFTEQSMELIGGTYNRLLYKSDKGINRESALNPNLDWDGVVSDYNKNQPGITYVDNFLQPEALEALYEYCMESTVWFDRRDAGYFGAYLDDGFDCPLLLQIADESRKLLPAFLKDNPLRYLWAYKYDKRLDGIAIHADSAAINVNFWVTPDEANLDSETGGLVVYKALAPLSWDFDKFNRDTRAINKFLAEEDKGFIKIPYKRNRAVIFNSNLLHKTDTFNFRDGYENRRINITMLFGDRK